MEEDNKKLLKKLNEIRVDRKSSSYQGISDLITKWKQFFPLITELRDDAMRPRHWE